MSSSPASPRAEALVIQMGYIDHVLKTNAEGLTHDDSLVQPQPGGNCLNWILGHVVATRNQTLTLLGKEPIWDSELAERYARGSEPITGPDGRAVPLAEILEAFDTSQTAILAGLGTIADDELDQMVPWFGGEATRFTALAGLVFHETYHVGQTGVLRRLTGHDGAIG